MAAREKKLLLHEKVEVRSLDDGFLGSWHTGVVIGYEELVRVVQYEHLLCDDSSDKLVERVKVTPAVDGDVNKETKRPDEYRGLIRPSPSSCVPGTWSLHYGECVDLLYEDAWWEGVVFDHEDGCESRRIFFPDMGDEMEGMVENLRISKDWDEVTMEWKHRGNWLFLELIEEVEQDLPLLVSVKQIWYEVRMKNGFEKLREWTSSERDLWKELLVQVLYDNLKVTVKQFFADLNASWTPEEPELSLLEFSDKTFDSVLKYEGLFHSSHAVVPFKATFQSDHEGFLQTNANDKSNNQVQEQNDQVPTSCILTNEQTPPPISTHALQILSRNPDEDSGIGSNNYDESPSLSLKLPLEEHYNSTRKKGLEWKQAVPQLISGGEYFPNAIEECNKLYRLDKKNPSRELRLKASKHLVHLGWKIEFACKNGTKEYKRRYFSPDGNLSYSFRKVCKMFDHDCELGPGSQMLMSPNNDIEISVNSLEETLSPPGKSQVSESSKLCTSSDYLVIEPEHCPEAVRDYYLFSARKEYRGGSNKERNLKARKAMKHLSAIGWSFYYHPKRHRREMRYISPTGTKFFSLASVCKWLTEAGAVTPDDLTSAIGRVINKNVINDFDDDSSTNKSHLPLVVIDSPGNLPLVENGMFGNMQSSEMPMSGGFVQSIKGEIHRTRISRKRRKHDKPDCIEGSLSPKRGRKSRASMGLKEDSNADSSTPVRRSSKRVRDRVTSSSQQIPRTVLSWLIDNNMVLPREKVQYRSKKYGVLKEGRITREGIKCSCCGNIFTLSKFEAHAGSTDHGPSASIFLEDGRSLLECQLQLKQRNSKQNSRLERELKGARHNKANDYICSVCHYGGELVLCDQCPSSFHTHCLGLKDVPDGDWFCPSCCCQICNSSRSNNGNALAADSSFLICGQCERRYHEGCLKREGDTYCYSEGYWFCHNTCQQIFYGLRRIMGKKVPVGTENLSWTLVKYMESDFSKHDVSDDEGSVENYSKLNVALSVMHECFEPVKEPRTRRDLMEDVVFNRGSELNRLNFKGFYTVLLEKEDELISAATVRIYGKTVAEVPLVATRFQYRRLGMCRILMNELEKKLAELGVERLVLPAIPSVLNTWITSFGFSKMNETERLNFLVYTFLDFQGTVFCQKLLKINLPVVLSLSAETQANSWDHVNNNVDIGLGGNSAVSEVFEGKQVEETGIAERESTCIKAVADNANTSCSAETAVVVDQPILSDCSPFQSSLECSVGVATNDEQPGKNSDCLLKCYKRRKVPSAC